MKVYIRYLIFVLEKLHSLIPAYTLYADGLNYEGWMNSVGDEDEYSY